MERETTKITTPVGKVEIVLKKWLTGGEKMDMASAKPEGFIEWMIKATLISPDFAAVKELHGQDFDFVLDKIRAVIDESTWSDKKKV
jgi:hypothetical protein